MRALEARRLQAVWGWAFRVIPDNPGKWEAPPSPTSRIHRCQPPALLGRSLGCLGAPVPSPPHPQLPGGGVGGFSPQRTHCMLPQLKLRRRILATVGGALLRGFRMSGQDVGWTLARGGSQDQAPLLQGGGVLTRPPPPPGPAVPVSGLSVAGRAPCPHPAPAAEDTGPGDSGGGGG